MAHIEDGHVHAYLHAHSWTHASMSTCLLARMHLCIRISQSFLPDLVIDSGCVSKFGQATLRFGRWTLVGAEGGMEEDGQLALSRCSIICLSVSISVSRSQATTLNTYGRKCQKLEARGFRQDWVAVYDFRLSYQT